MFFHHAVAVICGLRAERAERHGRCTGEAMDARLQSLMERMCQLGRLLPAERDLDTDDAVGIAEIKIVIAELGKTEAEMYARMKELREQPT